MRRHVGSMQAATRGPVGPALERWLSAHATDPVIVLAEDGYVLFANAAARAGFGDELQAFLAPEAELAMLEDAARDGHATLEHVTTSYARRRTYAVRAVAIDRLTVVTARETTKQRSLEDELSRLRRVEPVGHVAASLAHDLNNVLAVLLAVSELLERELPPEGRATDFTRELRTAAQHGAAMVRQVLGLVRGELGGRQGGGLPRLLDDLRPLLERVAGSDVKVELEIAPDLGEAAVDRDQLTSVLLNLAANARDAMPNGGRLRLQAKNVRFEACPGDAAPPGQGYVALLVTDDGVGMADEVREHVLDGYVSTKAMRGTGLGLVGAHRFVTAAGGCLSIRSAPGDGTTIALYLPHVGARDTPTLHPPPRLEPVEAE